MLTNSHYIKSLMSNITFDPITKQSIDTVSGHHVDHIIDYSGTINRPGLFNKQKPKCRIYNKRRCGAGRLLSKQTKKVIEGNYLKGYCIVCWKKYCEDKEWDYDLGYRANEICDHKKLSMDSRKLLDQHNLKSELNLPGDKIYMHVSDKRRELGEARRDRDEMEELGSDSKSNSLSGEEFDENYVDFASSYDSAEEDAIYNSDSGATEDSESSYYDSDSSYYDSDSDSNFVVPNNYMSYESSSSGEYI